MNFAEVRFWLLLIGGLVLLLLLRPLVLWVAPARRGSYDRLALAALGLGLLLAVNARTCLIFLTVGLLSYVAMWSILRWRLPYARLWALVVAPLLLLPLFYFKYASFVANGILHLEWDSLRDLLIPVGISFYSFQMVGFVIDTLFFKQPLPKFLDFINFAAFFPQIVAGPIERRADLLPQMEHFRFRWLPEGLNDGVSWIAAGFFFKCALADNLSQFIPRESVANAWLIWAANFLFGLRIYFDFAGYSLIAVGLGRCFGVRLTLNFLSPYCSTSFVEFWRRWHVTLSQWFRDYVYKPLGGGRTRRWTVNVALVFLVSGAWHGAGWNFLLWGALHGLFLMFNRLLGGRVSAAAPVTWLVTMLGAFTSWLAFYETDSVALLAKSVALATPAAYSASHLSEAVSRWQGGQLVSLVFFVALASATWFAEWLSIRRSAEPYSLLLRKPMTLVLVILTLLLAPGVNNAFIYFAF